jgi:hypothetical protein
MVHRHHRVFETCTGIETVVSLAVQFPQSAPKRKQLKIKGNLMRPVWPAACIYRSVCAQHRTRECGSIFKRKEVKENGDSSKDDQGIAEFQVQDA